MRKFDLATLDLVDEDHISLTLIRPAVMSDDSIISRVETFTVSRNMLPSSVVVGLNDFVESVLEGYARGTLEIADQIDSDADHGDLDAIELRS